MVKRNKKCYRLRYYIKVFFTHLFSHVGLCGLVVGYSVVGAFLFESLEGQPAEPTERPTLPRDKRREIDDFRARCLEELWAINMNQSILPVLRKPNWTELTLPKLQQLEESIIGVVTSQRSTGRVEVVEWSFSSALLYSVTVITTIGYGHITPRTDGGKIMTIFYALIGVPLMLLCLTNIGQLMANTFRFTYWSCTVIWRPRRPQATRTSVRYSQKRSSATAAAAAAAALTSVSPGMEFEEVRTQLGPAGDAARARNASGGRTVIVNELGVVTRHVPNDVGMGVRVVQNGPSGTLRTSPATRGGSLLRQQHTPVGTLMRQQSSPAGTLVRQPSSPGGIIRRHPSSPGGRRQPNGPGGGPRGLLGEPSLSEPDCRGVSAGPGDLLRTSGPATPIKLLDKETRDILVECAEYVLTEELSSLLETSPQRRGVFRDRSGSKSETAGGEAGAGGINGVVGGPGGVGGGVGASDANVNGPSEGGDVENETVAVPHVSGDKLVDTADDPDAIIDVIEAMAGGDAEVPVTPVTKNSTSATNHVTFSTPVESEKRQPPTPPCRKSSLASRPRSGRNSAGSSGRSSPQRLPTFPTEVPPPPSVKTVTAGSVSPSSSAAERARRRSDASPARGVNITFDSDSLSLGPATPQRKLSSPARRAAVNIEHPHLRKISRSEKRMRRLATRQCSELSGASTLLSTPSSLDSGVYSSSQRFTFPEPAAALEPEPDELVQVEVVKTAGGQRAAGRVPIPLVLGFVAMYICMGAGIFAWWEEWRFLDGAYFCFITLSTIGFGDLVPGTKVLRAETQEDQLKLVFCCLYLILGLAIIAMSFSLVQEEVIVKCKEIGKCTGILYDSDAEDE
ncbi:uncharacterized protein LOC122390781 [Amphibalanus amphitrite]|uniref:uncharacterized protein LOC122390781 n=1 Tax=Amphibalanus amphitrite TaxID=1232801 RepID=UPI001C8FFCCF|nr:uncharacterized protein LOC122390781 [Amphibalanus amphitrite]XP_043239997.1 uncharacterized protein LOC122390781 [Amphibalanus amphitrite]